MSSLSPAILADQIKFRESMVAALGMSAATIEREHIRRQNKGGDLAAANCWLRDYVEGNAGRPVALPRSRSGGCSLPADADEGRIGLAARAIAAESAAVLASSDDPAGEVAGIAAGFGVAEAFGRAVDRGETWRRRVICIAWWRRQLRRAIARRAEAAMIREAFVARYRAAYCSGPALARWRERAEANARLLAEMVAIPSNGGAPVPLADLAASTNSNPQVRRAELMVRVRGFEDVAGQRGDVGLFLTITAPSRFHRFAGSGAENPNWCGASPIDAQRHLCTVWARARAKLARDRVAVYGLRVAEPHHDGCPHWHMVIFAAPTDAERVIQVVRSYALADNPDEPGAAQHRFTAIRCDPARGSATAYIAAYVAKNIDGHRVGLDVETGQRAKTAAERVRAWASTWGIRQFQFLGGPPVTVWRELRRLARSPNAESCPDALRPLMQSADSGSWADFTGLMGGPVARRDQRPLSVQWSSGSVATGEVYVGRYADVVRRIVGLAARWCSLPTRFLSWVVGYAGAAGAAAARRIGAAVQPTGPPELAGPPLLL